ncbi:MAG: tetratricopeptide repeat protein [Candidatus Methylomirabilales bacterium]
MRCAACDASLLPEYTFCPHCGRKAPVVCASCASECSPDFAFCPRCGAALGAPAGQPPPAPREPTNGREPSARLAAGPAADRRPVSVLFADLSDFTALCEHLDAEEVRALQTDLLREMTAVVEGFDGLVEKFVGDAIMAVFGAPAAHENDPERAVRAAVAMHARLAALNAAWGRRLDRPLALHIGINTGPVVTGSLGPTAGAPYAVTGDTVNLAARLQAAAQPGETLVGPATHQLTQHAFSFAPLGPIRVKGKAEPVAAYRLAGELAAPRPGRGLAVHGVVTPLVGRDEEMDQLLAAFGRMRANRAQVVSLVGQAGAGKSRLLAEFLDRLRTGGRLEGVVVRQAACSALGEQPYGVLAAFFRQGYGVAATDTLETAQRKVRSGLEAVPAVGPAAASVLPLLGYVLGVESADLLRLEPAQLKRQIFLALRMLVERRLDQGPLLLVVEDLHWADAASVEVLRFVVDRLAERPLMLLTTYRPTFDARSLLPARAAHTTIRLRPLSADQVESLLAACLGPGGGLPDRLRGLIVRRAGGNPFYLEEMLRGLIAQGALVRGASGWTCGADPVSLEVPPTLQGLLLARLDRLPAGARRRIQEAAVLGPVFEEDMLRLLSSPSDDSPDALDALLDAELLTEEPVREGEGPGRRYRFTHELVREVIYQSLLAGPRAELHARAGGALECLCAGNRPRRLEDLEVLGHHFSLSADRPKGVRYLVAAGDWARGIYANDDAVRLYQRALETLRLCDDGAAERHSVCERLGELLALTGRREAALEHYRTAQEGYRTAADRPAEARVYRKTGRLHWEAGDRERALECFRAGLALLEGNGEHVEMAALCQEMGRLAFRGGDNHRAIEWAERALAHAEKLAAEDEEGRREAAAATAHAYNTLGISLARLGDLDRAVARIERSIAVAEAHGLLQTACRGYTNLGVLYSALDPGRAIQTSLQGLEVAKKIGDLGHQSRLYANLAVAYCALTDRCEDEGIRAAEAAAELDRQLGQLDHLAIPLIVLAQIHQCEGDAERAFQHYREALALAESSREPQLLFPCYEGLATLYLDRGDPARAEEYLRKAREVCEESGVEAESLTLLPFLE